MGHLRCALGFEQIGRDAGGASQRSFRIAHQRAIEKLEWSQE